MAYVCPNPRQFSLKSGSLGDGRTGIPASGRGANPIVIYHDSRVTFSSNKI